MSAQPISNATLHYTILKHIVEQGYAPEPGELAGILGATNAETEAALAFLRFTQSDEYQLKMSEVGQLTVIPALIETDYFQNHPYYGTFLTQLETAKARTPHPRWTQMEEVLTEAGQLILRGEASAQEALDVAAEEIDALLAE